MHATGEAVGRGVVLRELACARVAVGEEDETVGQCGCEGEARDAATAADLDAAQWLRAAAPFERAAEN